MLKFLFLKKLVFVALAKDSIKLVYDWIGNFNEINCRCQFL